MIGKLIISTIAVVFIVVKGKSLLERVWVNCVKPGLKRWDENAENAVKEQREKKDQEKDSQ